jgi:hypothetical protein
MQWVDLRGPLMEEYIKMSNFLDAVSANPIPETKINDTFSTKLVKNTANAIVDRSVLAPLLGTPAAPLAIAGVATEGLAMTVAESMPNIKSFFNAGPIRQAIGKDLGILKIPAIHSKTQITSGPGQLTQDQQNLTNLMKLADQQQQKISQMDTTLNNINQDLYGDGGPSSENNYDP